MPDDAWAYIEPLVAARYAAEPWPVEIVVLHLRWLLGERWTGRMKASEFPDVRTLAAAWHWGRHKADDFVRAVDAWQIEERRMDLVSLRGDRGRKPIGDKKRQLGDNSGTQPTDERTQSDADTGTRGQLGDKMGTCARLTPRVPSLHLHEHQGGCAGAREAPADSALTATATATATTKAREAPPATIRTPSASTATTPTGTANDCDDDLVAYLGLGMQGHARKLAEAGVTSRLGLLRLTVDELRHTSGLGGAWAAAILRAVADHGDQLATAPARASPRNGHAAAPPGESALDRARRRLPTRTPDPP